MNGILFITNEVNWNTIKENNVMGIGGRWGSRLFPKIENKDMCVIYIKTISVFSGVYEILNKTSKKQIKWNTGNYNYLLDLKKISVLQKTVPVRELINELKFIKNKKEWRAHFRFERIIPINDINIILKYMNQD